MQKFLFFLLVASSLVGMQNEQTGNSRPYDFEEDCNDRFFFCPECKHNISVNADGNLDLKFHLENVHGICDVCRKKFDSGRAVRSHFLMNHVTRDMIKPMERK